MRCFICDYSTVGSLFCPTDQPRTIRWSPDDRAYICPECRRADELDIADQPELTEVDIEFLGTSDPFALPVSGVE
jgi:hypothetical protein